MFSEALANKLKKDENNSCRFSIVAKFEHEHKQLPDALLIIPRSHDRTCRAMQPTKKITHA